VNNGGAHNKNDGAREEEMRRGKFNKIRLHTLACMRYELCLMTVGPLKCCTKRLRHALTYLRVGLDFLLEFVSESALKFVIKP
jgi:hypothetical protein